jgi:hypothetical protein
MRGEDRHGRRLLRRHLLFAEAPVMADGSPNRDQCVITKWGEPFAQRRSGKEQHRHRFMTDKLRAPRIARDHLQELIVGFANVLRPPVCAKDAGEAIELARIEFDGMKCGRAGNRGERTGRLRYVPAVLDEKRAARRGSAFMRTGI